MKPLQLLFLICLPLQTLAQSPDFPGIQQSWLSESRIKDEIGINVTEDFFIYGAELRAFLSAKSAIYSEIAVYKHDEHRFLTLGEIETTNKQLFVATGWVKNHEKWLKTIEILLPVAQLTKPDNKLLADIEIARKRWVELANQHRPFDHVSATYSADAQYFGAGELSEGHEEIAGRYYYMENPDYQVSLEETYVTQIDSVQVFETGRYFTGSERRGLGGIYVIIWEKTADGNWLIKLDFNF